MKIVHNVLTVLVFTSFVTMHIDTHSAANQQTAIIMKKCKKAWKSNWVKAGTITATCALLYVLGVQLHLIAPVMCASGACSLKKDLEKKIIELQKEIDSANFVDDQKVQEKEQCIQKLDLIKQAQKEQSENRLWGMLAFAGGITTGLCGYKYMYTNDDIEEDYEETSVEALELEDDFFDVIDEIDAVEENPMVQKAEQLLIQNEATSSDHIENNVALEAEKEVLVAEPVVEEQEVLLSTDNENSISSETIEFLQDQEVVMPTDDDILSQLTEDSVMNNSFSTDSVAAVTTIFNETVV